MALTKNDLIKLLQDETTVFLPPYVLSLVLQLIDKIVAESGGGATPDLEAVLTAGNTTTKGVHITNMDPNDFSATTAALRLGRYSGYGGVVQANGDGAGVYELLLILADKVNMQLINKTFNLSGRMRISGSGGDPTYPLEVLDYNTDDNISAIFTGNIQIPTATEPGHAIPLGQGATLTGIEQLENKTMKEPIVNGPTLNVVGGGDATGDMYYRGGDGKILKIAAGTEGQSLKWVSGAPIWVD